MSVPDGLDAETGMPMPEKEKLQNIKVPAFAANYPVGHGGTYRQPYGGELTVPALAWLKWQLQDDDKAAKMFIGFPCELEGREGWTIEKNDLIE